MNREDRKQLDHSVFEAVEKFALKVTVPIFSATNDIVDLVGTGTFFKAKNRHFLITAAHIFEDIKPADLAIPQSNTGKRPIHLIGDSSLWTPSNDYIKTVDIAIVEIQSDETINIIESGWQSLTLDNVASPSPHGRYLLCGFPSKKARKDGEDFVGQMVLVISERLDKIPPNAAKPVDENIDLFFLYGNVAFNIDGEKVSIPILKGASGASVWQIQKQEGVKFWTPENSLKVVGIQSSALHGEFFRAKDWSYVRQMLKKIDVELVS
ncbi:MAG: hypothetical protein ABJA10_08265 [Aestuariivirga sp.]